MLHDPSDDLATLPDWARKERPMASMLPYVSLVNDVTIRTRGNALFQCIRLDGVNSMTSDDAHLEKIRALFRGDHRADRARVQFLRPQGFKSDRDRLATGAK